MSHKLSTIYSLLLKFNKDLQVGDLVTVKNDDNVIVTYLVKKESKGIVMISDRLVLNKKYSIFVNDRHIYDYYLDNNVKYHMISINN